MIDHMGFRVRDLAAAPRLTGPLWTYSTRRRYRSWREAVASWRALQVEPQSRCCRQRGEYAGRQRQGT
jgi:hypothetical protein